MSHREGAPRSHADVDGARGPCTSHIESEGNLMWIGWKAISLGVVSGGAIAVALYSSLAAGSAAPSASIPISQTVPTAVYADCVEPAVLEGDECVTHVSVTRTVPASEPVAAPAPAAVPVPAVAASSATTSATRYTPAPTPEAAPAAAAVDDHDDDEHEDERDGDDEPDDDERDGDDD